MKKIYVGNLSFNTSEDDLRQLFGEHGAVESVDVIMDRQTGQSRGFGFIQMAPADADKAITALDGSTVGDRSLKVNEAKPRRDSGGSDHRRSY